MVMEQGTQKMKDSEFYPAAAESLGAAVAAVEVAEVTFLADVAHNPHGLKLLCDFVSKLDYSHKIGVISGTGDRRDEDIRELGEIAANYFDEIIIRCDKNLRGREAEEIINLLKEGIDKTNPNLPTTIIQNEDEALDYAYANAPAGSLVTIMCDVVARALDKIKELKEKEEYDFGGLKLETVRLNHPSPTLTFKIVDEHGCLLVLRLVLMASE